MRIKTLLLILSFSLFLLTSCSGKLGYGVILWAPEDSIASTGELVIITDESRLSESYTYKQLESREKFEIEMWRIEFFESQREAEDFEAKYSEYNNSYAICNSRGLPIRAEMDSKSVEVYKLRDQQQVKVIGRSDEKVTISRFEGYWYELLTPEGVRGFTFDYHLSIASINENNELITEEKEEIVDEDVSYFCSQLWRPNYYKDMVEIEGIDLNRFRVEYGLRIDQELKTISYISAESVVNAEYTEIISTGFNQYSFIGTSFILQVYTKESITFQFNDGVSEKKETLVLLENSVEEEIANEQARRRAAMNAFVAGGPEYSGNGGSITFNTDGTFNWSGKSSLIEKGMITARTGDSGYWVFDAFPGKDIMNRYQGGLRFYFGTGEWLTFLYNISGSTIEFKYIPEKEVDKNIIDKDSYYGVISLTFNGN